MSACTLNVPTCIAKEAFIECGTIASKCARTLPTRSFVYTRRIVYAGDFCNDTNAISDIDHRIGTHLFCMCSYVCVFVCVCMRACAHVRMCACAYVHMCACANVRICACAHVRMCACACACAYTCARAFFYACACASACVNKVLP